MSYVASRLSTEAIARISRRRASGVNDAAL